MFKASFAFQPIVDVEAMRVFAYEALVRGPHNEPAGAVFATVPASERYAFDRDARTHAIAKAASLGITTGLCLNMLPKSLDAIPDAVSATVEAAIEARIPAKRLFVEVTESEMIENRSRFVAKMNEFRRHGINIVIDDFGAGHSGLNLLADFTPDILKLDMQLVRSIDSDGPRQAIVRAILQCCNDLGIEVIAEGVEFEAEYRWFQRRGVRLFQGFLFGRPAFESFPAPHWPTARGHA